MFLISRDLLKNFLRFINYKLHILKKKKIDYSRDSHYPLVSQLRGDGIAKIENFSSYEDSAKKLLNTFNLIKNQDIINFINKNKSQSKSNKESIKLDFSEFFLKDDLLNYANSPKIIRNISQYFGCKPIPRYVSAWLDYPNDNFDEHVLTQIFHRDPDDFKLVKTFFYLNDVTEDNGPFEYIKKSHLKPWINFFDNKERENYIRSNFNDNDFLTAKFNKDTLLISDTNGFHRGNKLKNGFRALITVMYTSLTPRLKSVKDLYIN